MSENTSIPSANHWMRWWSDLLEVLAERDIGRREARANRATARDAARARQRSPLGLLTSDDATIRSAARELSLKQPALFNRLSNS